MLCLLSDSTNAERPGFSESEQKVGATFENLFQKAGDRRIIIATFSSNIHRIQQIVNMAVRTGRKVAVSGRSMVNVVAKAIELGYLNVPKDVLVDIDNIGRYPSNRLVICTTGSQGEPLSALSRMAAGEHRKVNVTANDYIIISATPIPGNEKHVTRVINELLKLGAEVIYKSMYEVHVSGHACQGDLKMMLSITKPKFFIPLHGEYKHLISSAQLAKDMGISPDRIMITDIGQVTELDGETMRPGGSVEAGRVFVDGYGVGDVGSDRPSGPAAPGPGRPDYRGGHHRERIRYRRGRPGYRFQGICVCERIRGADGGSQAAGKTNLGRLSGKRTPGMERFESQYQGSTVVIYL